MSMDVLQEKIRKFKNPSMAGLDPSPELIPEHLLREAFAQHGETPVSYTHLDVYKRQALGGRPRTGRSTRLRRCRGRCCQRG